jgi:hypothetical protein
MEVRVLKFGRDRRKKKRRRGEEDSAKWGRKGEKPSV